MAYLEEENETQVEEKSSQPYEVMLSFSGTQFASHNLCL